MSRFKQDQTGQEALSETVKLADVKAEITIQSSMRSRASEQIEE
jgi:hypothetical protein